MSSAVSSAGGVVAPEGRLPPPAWSEQQLQSDIARIPVLLNNDLSAWFLRLVDREQPHLHEESALLVHLLEGRGILHFDNHDVSIGPGDVLLIPRGVRHWVENTGPVPLLAFAVFAPANTAPATHSDTQGG